MTKIVKWGTGRNKNIPTLKEKMFKINQAQLEDYIRLKEQEARKFDSSDSLSIPSFMKKDKWDEVVKLKILLNN